MKTLAYIAISACLLLCGCGTHANKMNNVSIGMTSDDVIKAVGQPLNISNDGQSEIMNYRLVEDSFEGTTYPYIVVLQGGKVVSYGRMGSDSSAHPPKFQPIIIPAAK